MARTFGGTTADKIQFANSSAINITGTAFSFSIWMRKADTGTRRYLFGKAGASASPFAYAARVDSSNLIVFLIDDGTATFNVATSTTTVSANTLYHVVGVKNGTGGGAIKIYINGVQEDSTVSNLSLASNTADLTLGYQWATATSEIWSGDLAEFAIWNVALTAADVASLSKGFSPALIRPQNLAFYPPLVGRASPELDLRGAGGTVTGTSAGAHPRIYNRTRGQVGRARVTVYTQAVAGTLSSAGNLTRSTGKALAGTLTSSGTLLKRTAKTFAGTLTSSGTLAAIRLFVKAIGGTLSSSGNLTRSTGKALAGTLTSSGTLLKRTAKSMAGTLTSAGSLSAIRLFVKAIGGTLTSAGTLTKRTGKVAAGTLTSSGSLIKRIAKTAAGTLTSSGALTTTRVLLKAIGGTLSSSGALTKRTGKSVAGTLTSSGSLVKRIAKTVAGTLSSTGGLVKRIGKRIGGTLTSSGATLVQAIIQIIFKPSAALTVTVPAESRSGAATDDLTIVVPPETRSG